MVAISSTVGNEENSSGVWMNNAVIRISTDRMIDSARLTSSSTGGSGRISTTRMVSTPTASARSPRLKKAPISPRPGSLMPLVAEAGAAVMSLIQPNAAMPPAARTRDNTKVINQEPATGDGGRGENRGAGLPKRQAIVDQL